MLLCCGLKRKESFRESYTLDKMLGDKGSNDKGTEYLERVRKVLAKGIGGCKYEIQRTSDLFLINCQVPGIMVSW